LTTYPLLQRSQYSD